MLAASEVGWAAAQSVAWGPAPYATHFRALWNGSGLLLRFDADDSSPWFTLVKHDDHLWEEEVVEIFLDLDRSGRNYAELEISPGNVVCDVRMVTPWPNKRGELAWNIEGLETRVIILKSAAGENIGWTATAFLPWAGFHSLPSAGNISLPPQPQDRWRFNVFRIKRPGGHAAPQVGAIEAAWSPPPGASFHVPEVFRDFAFTPR